MTSQTGISSKRERVAMASGPHSEAASYLDDPDIITEPLGDVIDTNAFTPRLIALISNALVRRESRLLLREFDLGTNDWRVISALAIRPGAASTDVSDFLAMNKAVVSKSVNTLIARRLVVAADGPRGSRPLYLTQAGARMHAAMKPISMAGQTIALAGLSADEVTQLNALLIRILASTPALDGDVGVPGDELSTEGPVIS